jgi:4-hydroxy-3-methylbut-2-enyl diphosphate reductase
MRPVICTPLAVERLAVKPARTPVRRTGMGPDRSARGAAQLAGRPVLVAGVAGGLAPGIAAGDVVVATEVRGAAEVVPCPAAPLLAGELRRLGLTVHLGPIVSTPGLSWGAAARDTLAGTGALAVDTESAWLAPPAVRDGAGRPPFAVVRVISDTATAGLLSPGILPRGIRALAGLRRCVPAFDAWAAAARPRDIWLADPRSFCAGVERAIEIVERALDRYGAPVYIRRQVVHNAHVVTDLERRGAVFVDEAGQVPPGGVLVLAAHGVSPAVRREAAARNLSVIDATCPLVAKVHSEVRRYTARGDTVLLIGHADHEEVQGTVGEAPAQVVVVGSVAEARAVQVADPQRVAYAMQTTLAVDEAEGIAAELRQRFPSLAGPRREDICYATTNRQQAVRAIAGHCDAVIVVGSANSSNSLRLVEVARREGVTAHLVDDASQVRLDWVAGTSRLGITAGASAPPSLVEDLVTAVAGLGPATVHRGAGEPEDVHFTLPKEVS